ncbi:MAG: ABC transporter ATP-binding protein [Spirochaetes bacterium]|nr:ABC transporter ATP-binding protein [Spirochaetota bacterium]
MSFLIFDNVCYRYRNGFRAVENMNFSVKSGGIFGIAGEKRSGKSSVVNLITGVSVPYCGIIRLNDTVINDVKVKNRKISAVFPEPVVFPSLKVIHNITIPLKNYKNEKYFHDKKIIRICEILKIDDILNRKASRISDYQKQLVALTRSVMKNPELLVLDDPCRNMSQVDRKEFISCLIRLKIIFGLTVIYVSENIKEVLAVSDSSVVLQNGRILQEGTSDEIYSSPNNREIIELLYDRQINRFDALCCEKNDTLYFSLGDNINFIPAKNKIEKFRLYVNQKIEILIPAVSFIIRPDGNSESIKCRVDFVENYMGYRVIHCVTRSRKYLIKTVSTGNFTRNQLIHVIPDFKKIYYTDKSNGRNILHVSGDQ